MKRPEHQLDKHGFPVPAKFDHPQPSDPPQKPSGRRGRWVLLALLLLVAVALVVESPLMSAGRRAIGNFYLQRAQQQHLNGDLPAALAEIDAALGYFHDEPGVYELRGRWRLEAKDFEGSLADFTQAIEMDGKWSQSFLDRSLVYQRMGRQREALDDLNQAVKYRTARDPLPFNARAYGRALAGVELEGALEDVEQAILFDTAGNNPAFLDTRGYIHYLLGHYEQALQDLNQAIKHAEAEQKQVEKLGAQPGRDQRLLARAIKYCHETLAVLYHHRGQIHEKLGDSVQAKSDLKRGDQLGYNPAEGVF